MSAGKALYFPYIHFQDEGWLKYALLYWDCIKRIVPRHYRPHDSETVRTLADEGVIENVDPSSGVTPYTVGAAEEFIPTIRVMARKRPALSAGVLVARKLDENTLDGHIHVQKMDERVIRLLSDADMAKQCGDWFAMDGALAGYYMLCLAAHISEKQKTPLLSDSFEMETGGTFFQHSRISADLVEKPEDNAGFQLAKLLMPVPRPREFASISTKTLLRFRKKYEAERMQFRQAVEEIVEGAAALEDRSAIKDFLEAKKKIIGRGIQDQKKSMEELGVEAVSSLACISVPATIAAGVALAGNPIAAAIGTVGGVALTAVAWYAKARGKRREAVRKCDWHYLLTLQRRFACRKVAENGRIGMNQFIYD